MSANRLLTFFATLMFVVNASLASDLLTETQLRDRGFKAN